MYDIRQIERSPEGLRACQRLLAETFPNTTQFTPEYLEWQYNQNPAGAAVGFNAWAGETLAAHYVTLPIRGRWNGRPSQGLLSLNTATHPEHQGKKLFTTLAEATYTHARERGYEFVVGVANANSTPGFTRKLGFTLVAPLEARLGLGPVPPPAEGFAPGYEATWDAELLRWRLANPARRYRVVRHGERCRVEAPTGRLGIQAILAELPAELMDGLPPSALSRGPNPVRVWLGLEPGARWSRSLYRTLPRRLRPSPLNLIFKDLTGRGPLPEAGNLRFRALDFDAY